MSKLSVGLVVALAAAPVFAQSTSSGIAGQIVDAGGAPVSGADVTIVHVESGTVSHATTDANGYYNVRGLRAGGPYTVKASKGDASQTEEGVYVELNSVASVSERLGGMATNLGTVQVTGNRTLLNTFNSDNKGIGTNISGRALETAVQGNRSIDDIARLDPRIQITDQGTGAISMAGQNSRYNTISVDGLSQGDPFGLNANGMPYTGSPISPETIAAYHISTTDYDTGSDAVGANINAVTKSGTNDFHGSAYYGFRNASSMVGNYPNGGGDYTGFDKDKLWGVTVGGPIVKDKLFFFAAYEDEKVTGLTAGTDGYTYPSPGKGEVTQEDIDRVISIANAKGVPGDHSYPPNFSLEDKRYLGKLDWNIADGHRASFTYQKTEETKPTPYNQSTYAVILSSHWYNINSTTENYALQFFDDWTDNFSTETKLSYQKFDQVTGAAADSPDIRVGTPAGGYIYLGEDQYRAENEIHTKKFQGSFAGIWNLGSHTVKGGIDYLSEKVADVFGKQLHGVYQFSSIDDFAAGNYASYTVTTLPSGISSVHDPRFEGAWTYKQYSPFLQDTWQVTDDFSLIYGVRVDIPDASTAPPLNQKYVDAFGFANNSTLDSSNKVVEPRVGFNWQLGEGDQLMQVRGGVGLFQSVPPVVWLTNPYINNGVYSLITHNSSKTDKPAFSADPYNQNIPGAASAGQMSVDALDPDFKLPTVWKATLGFDAALPWWGLIGTVEYQHLKNKDAIVYLAPNIGTPSGTLPDGRYQYWVTPDTFGSTASTKNNGSNRSFTTTSTYLTNTSAGGSDALTFALTKPMQYGFSGNLSVTLTHATEVNQGSSSQSSSNYSYVVRTNPNEVIATAADYEVPLAVKASLNWDHAFWGDYKTTVSLFYNGHSGTPYTWVFQGGYSGDVNGDGIGYEDPAYIPTLNDSKVSYVQSDGTPATQAQIDAFQKFISGDKYLGTHRGQIASRNSSRLPWSNELDLGLQQELPGFFKDNKFIVRLDIYNFLNLLNKDWGEQYWNGGYDTADFVPVYGIKDGQYQYNIYNTKTGAATWVKPTTYYNNSAYPQRTVSLWSAMLTVKYTF